MRIFVAASYSSEVDYSSGEVFEDYHAWLEDVLSTIEKAGHEVFCALREDNYKINKGDPAAAYRLDMDNIKKSDAMLGLVDNYVSGGVQTEIGIAVALGKRVFVAHKPEDALSYFNAAMVYADVVEELTLPFDIEALRKLTA
ncbi:MAG TPA: nucleoside 2-deoxyribosyltransferase [Candidatus Saccharimonadales bacterium]